VHANFKILTPSFISQKKFVATCDIIWHDCACICVPLLCTATKNQWWLKPVWDARIKHAINRSREEFAVDENLKPIIEQMRENMQGLATAYGMSAPESDAGSSASGSGGGSSSSASMAAPD
jgi:hypothetical protein